MDMHQIINLYGLQSTLSGGGIVDRLRGSVSVTRMAECGCRDGMEGNASVSMRSSTVYDSVVGSITAGMVTRDISDSVTGSINLDSFVLNSGT